MRRFLVLLALSVLPLSGQERLVESLEVRVVNVDVVVTGRDGKPVTGLTKDDFEILEDKRRQTITNFYEIRGGAPAAVAGEADTPPPRPRNFILFVENRALHPVLRRHVTAELKKFVDAQLRAGDRASVISWSGTLSIDAPLTSDKAVLHAAIDKVANTGSPTSIKSEFHRVQQHCTRLLNLATSGRMPIRLAYEECIGDASIESQRLIFYSRLVLNAVELALSTIAGEDGRKVLVMAGSELPVEPGLELYMWANAAFGRYMRDFDAAIARPQDEERAQRELLEKIGRSANAHGATLYLVSALMPSDDYSAVYVNGISDHGADSLRSSNTEASHEVLAKLTGGIAAPLSRMSVMLETIGRDLDSYYSLGYRPSATHRGDRPITVRTKNRDYTVRARQSHAPKSFDEQMTDRVIANIFTPARENEWQVQLRAGAPKLVEKGRYTVDIEVIAAPSVTLIRQGNDLAGGFTVYVGVGSPQGALSTTFRQPNDIRFPAAEEAEFRREPLVFTATLTVREGENLLSVGVVDQVSNVAGFARATVHAAASK